MVIRPCTGIFGAHSGVLSSNVFNRLCDARDGGQEVGQIDKGENESREPEDVLIGEQREQAKNGNDIELHFLRPVRHPFGERMDGEKQDADAYDAKHHKPHDDIKQHIGLAGRRDEERQIMRHRWMELIGQCTFSHVLAQAPTVTASGPSGLIWIKGKGSAPDPSIGGKSRRMVNEEGPAMPVNIDELLPMAMEIKRQAAIADAEKAEQYARKLAVAEAEKRKLIERLSKPSGLPEEEKVQLAATVIQRAVRNGLSEVQIYRFPNSLCTDRGRAINQREPGWEKTLTGIPREIFQLWSDYLKPRGYRILYQVIDFPGGMPGDISIVLSWGDD